MIRRTLTVIRLFTDSISVVTILIKDADAVFRASSSFVDGYSIDAQIDGTASCIRKSHGDRKGVCDTQILVHQQLQRTTSDMRADYPYAGEPRHQQNSKVYVVILPT